MKDIRHWYIQKSLNHNCPNNQSKGVDEQGAVFTEFIPTVSKQGHEWIKVFSADDVHAKIGMGVTRYSDVMSALGVLRDAVEFYGDKNNWDDRWYTSPDGNEDNDGDIYDVICREDVEIEGDEPIYTKGGKKAREALASADKIMGEG